MKRAATVGFAPPISIIALRKDQARAFNALSKRRVRIEHVFAQLKTWRIIHHYYPMRPHTYATTFRAIAYIHNLNRLEKTGKLM
ncbi:transposase [Sinorhizobium meliloti]|nr:transposase [Sinorhizobium meliloti]